MKLWSLPSLYSLSLCEDSFSAPKSKGSSGPELDSMSFLRVTGKGRSYNDWGYEDKGYGKSMGKGWGKSSYEDSWGGGALEATT